MAKHAKQRRRPIRPIRIAIRNLQGKSAKNIAPEMATMPEPVIHLSTVGRSVTLLFHGTCIF